MDPPAQDDPRWADLFDALSNPYRRQLLVALLEHNPQDDDDQDPLDILIGGQAAVDLDTVMRHTHLPKLEAMGFIEWDKDADEISRGPNWNQIAPVLTLIHKHRDELPDGWLESQTA
jgi:hypothetical protein